jgi:DNA-binding NarL/FixJ family response regulator
MRQGFLVGKTCLIVEHDDTLAVAAERWLTSAGMCTRKVGSLADAMRELSRNVWQSILLDLSLPDGDGATIVRSALASAPPRPAILVTSERVDLLARFHLHELDVAFVPKTLLCNAMTAWLSAALSETATEALLPSLPDRPQAPNALDGAEALSLNLPDKKLSAREASILALLVRGRAPKEIAEHLGLSHATVRTHARNLYRKLGVSNVREALAALLRKEATLSRRLEAPSC